MIEARDVAALLPILLPALGGLWILALVAATRGRDVTWPAAHAMVFLALSGTSAGSLLLRGARRELFHGALLVDAQALLFQILFVVIAALTVLVAVRHLQVVKAAHGEFFTLLLFAVTGMTLMASSQNLLTIFLGLEILSISLYVLVGFARDEDAAVEGALKYFLLGAFSTGFVLYGIALFYGATGAIDLPAIAARVAADRGEPIDPLLIAGAALLLIGLAFKVAAVPFHFWAPDAYQGAMAPVAGFMAAGTKAAAFAALLRVVTVGLEAPPLQDEWTAILRALALLTMVLGNVIALAQRNVKRLLAYSSIANAGYLLVAVVAGATTGQGGVIVIFYLAAYAFMTIGAFAVAAMVGRVGEGEQGYDLAAYAGLSRRRPALAAAMAIFLLSLTGIPPTAGFVAKFYIFKGAVDAGLYGLAVTGVVASVIGAFYYLRILVQMYVRDPGPGAAPQPLSRSESLAVFAAAAATLAIGLAPEGILQLALRLVRPA